MAIHLHGNGVSKGIAIGYAVIIPRGHVHVTRQQLITSQVNQEVNRYEKALTQARAQLQQIQANIPSDLPTDIKSFIETHILMLSDPTLIDAPIEIIREQQCNAEWALKQQYDLLIRIFDEIDDAYLKTRRDDIAHVVNRILHVLLGETTLSDLLKKQNLANQVIIADDLSPAETVLLKQQSIAGFITEHGGTQSHTAILARSLEIPAVVGVRNLRNMVTQGEDIIIDGDKNTIILQPDKRITSSCRRKRIEHKRNKRSLDELRNQPAITANGNRINLQANIELPEDLKTALRIGCDGIGLFRTEYLFMNREHPPSEEEQFASYRQTVRKLKGIPLTIRTLDLGADKQVDSGSYNSAMPNNPALGLRAVRLCLQDIQLFHTQLRAILRASAWGPVKIMIPMISSIQEIKQVHAHIATVKAALDSRKINYARDIPLGTMIETPAAAISAREIVCHCDFLSIGTNDLIQYTLAVDRIDDAVNYLYDPTHPAILELIKNIIRAGRKANTPVSMCGEMAGDTRLTRLLLGLGLNDFSVHSSALLEVKSIILKTDTQKLARPVNKVLRAHDSVRLHDTLHEINHHL